MFLLKQLPDTFYTTPPEWTWWIIFYFFIGGIAGGSMFIAAMLQLFGRREDAPIVRTGYVVAFIGAIISGILLILDLHRPLRFWHMLLESETLVPMFKYWSPMSVGSWGLTFFGLFATLAMMGQLYHVGWFHWRIVAPLSRGLLANTIAVLGAIFGFFLAGYTGVLIAATNRPVWADSTWLGVLFLFSAASTAAATLILLGRWRDAHPASIRYLSSFDKTALVLELIALIIFLVSIGAAIQVFASWWGVMLALGVVVIGILLPLAIGSGKLVRAASPAVASAMLVLVGGFMLRVVVLLSSEAVHKDGAQVIVP